MVRCEPAQARQAKSKLIPAFGARQGMQLVGHDELQIAEDARCIGIGEQQRQGFRCRQKDIGRITPLPLTP